MLPLIHPQEVTVGIDAQEQHLGPGGERGGGEAGGSGGDDAVALLIGGDEVHRAVTRGAGRHHERTAVEAVGGGAIAVRAVVQQRYRAKGGAGFSIAHLGGHRLGAGGLHAQPHAGTGRHLARGSVAGGELRRGERQAQGDVNTGYRGAAGHEDGVRLAVLARRLAGVHLAVPVLIQHRQQVVLPIGHAAGEGTGGGDRVWASGPSVPATASVMAAQPQCARSAAPCCW